MDDCPHPILERTIELKGAAFYKCKQCGISLLLELKKGIVSTETIEKAKAAEA
jgi:hypothetical protein